MKVVSVILAQRPPPIPPAVRDAMQDIATEYKSIRESIEAANLVEVRHGHIRLGEAVAAVQAELIGSDMRPQWFEVAMLLRNDVAEGREIDSMQEADRVFALTRQHVDQMKAQFPLPMSHDEMQMPPMADMNVPPEVAEQLTGFVGPYLELGQSLAADDLDAAKRSVEPLRQRLAGLLPIVSTDKAVEVWDKEKRDLSEIVARLRKANDLETLRSGFALLSEQILSLQRMFGLPAGSVLYELHCPMAFEGRGASWIQSDDAVRNPYYGASMLKCADRVEELGVGERGSQGVKESGSQGVRESGSQGVRESGSQGEGESGRLDGEESATTSPPLPISQTPPLVLIFKASHEVAGAVLTAVTTTVVSFLPVFTMIGAEGKLFHPLAFTKTFALAASVIVALTIIPPAAHVLMGGRIESKSLRRGAWFALLILGIAASIMLTWWVGAILIGLSAYKLWEDRIPQRFQRYGPYAASAVAALVVGVLLTQEWLPLGPQKGLLINLTFVGGLIGGILGFFTLFQRFLYEPILRWCLNHKFAFLTLPIAILLFGGSAWLGFDKVFGIVPTTLSLVGVSESTVRQSRPWRTATNVLSGLGKEFMPPLDEGSFLYMPTTMPHASIGEAMDVLQLQNRLLVSIPEVESVVGKIGRADTPLDPAPVSMIETYITYKSEYISDEDGHRLNFRYDEEANEFVRDETGKLIPDPDGRPLRQWRDEIQSPDDIWQAITVAAEIPGTTSAPKLQPIAARIVMLQSGMRAPMGMKVKGPDLETIETVALELEALLKQVPTVQASAVIADRIVGKPYLEIDIDRDAIKRYGLHIRSVQDVIEVAIGGRQITTTVEGRERFPVRVRYARELRDDLESLERILVQTPMGSQIPLGQLADIRYTRGPQVIKSEDTFLLGYVLFDKLPGEAEVDVVEDAQAFLQSKLDSGEFTLPAGVTYTFAGNYENQIRSQKTLSIVLPLALGIIFLILYLQFKSAITTSLVFSGILIAWAGGFIMLWLYGTDWFLDFSLLGTNMRELFQVKTINLSVAVWVGFLALFGIASDDGVVIASYLDESFRKDHIENAKHAREATVTAGMRRVRPCLMTTATTLLALIPVLTSTGRGSDIMVPMAIPSFGGMTIEIMTMLVVPVLYCSAMEWKLRLGIKDERFAKDA